MLERFVAIPEFSTTEEKIVQDVEADNRLCVFEEGALQRDYRIAMFQLHMCNSQQTLAFHELLERVCRLEADVAHMTADVQT
jgi:hypothetical protein